MQSVLIRYLDKVIKDNSTIDARGVMQVNRMIELTMDEVFINLSVRMGRQEKLSFRNELIEKVFGINSVGTIYDLNIDPPLTTFDSVDMPRVSFMEDRHITDLETGVSTADLWTRHNAWVLLGDPGAGKTTLLKHFALQTAREHKSGTGHLPILLPLRLFAAEWEQQHTWAPQNAVLNYLADKGLSEIGFEQEQDRNELLGIFKKALSEGRAFLLFDGLDEQRNADMQRKSVAAIESLLQHNTGNRFLVSSRIIGYDAAPLSTSFKTATLEPFNDEQMEAFFRRWIYAVEKHEDIVVDESTKKRAEDKADELIEQVKNNTGIRTLSTNPLLCTIIGLIRRQGATLPQLRAELYKLCIDTFIFNWELQKRRRADQEGSLNKEQTQAVLEELALHFHEHYSENRATQQTITDIIRVFLVKQEGMVAEEATHKAGQLLSLIRDVSGLLIDRGNNEYGFFHLTFQEYLTARAITRRKRDIDRYLAQHLFEPRWREVILLAAAHQGMKDEETGSEFIEAILSCKHPHDAQMHYVFRFAFLCLREARVELETSDRMFREWVKLYLAQTELQYLLLRLLQPTPRYYPDSLKPLLAGLKDEDSEVRECAASALGQIMSQVAVPFLLVSIKDKDSGVRWKTAEALGQIKDPVSVPALIAALDDEDEMVHWSAANALGQIKDPAAVPALLAALKEGDDLVFWSAANALGQIKAPSVVPTLLAALKDQHNNVRRGAAIALGRIKDVTVATALFDAFQDKESDIRQQAVLAWSQVKGLDSLPDLLVMTKNKDVGIRLGATEALGQIKDPAVIPALLTLLKDRVSRVRNSAAIALGLIKDASAVPALLAALKDSVIYVQNSACRALGQIKDPSAVPALLIAIKHKNSDIRSTAARALGQIKDPTAVPALLVMLKDKDRYVVHNAVSALSEIKTPAVVPALLAELKNKHQWNYWTLVNALGRIKVNRPGFRGGCLV